MRRPPRILILLAAAICALFVWAASHRDQAGFAVQGERYGATGDHSPQVAPLLEPASKTLSQMPPRTATHRGRSMAMSVMAAQIKAAASGSGPCKTLVAIWIVRGHGTHLEVLTTPGGVGGAGVIDACVSRTAQLGAKAAEAAVDALLQESYGLRVRDTDFLSRAWWSCAADLTNISSPHSHPSTTPLSLSRASTCSSRRTRRVAARRQQRGALHFRRRSCARAVARSIDVSAQFVRRGLSLRRFERCIRRGERSAAKERGDDRRVGQSG